MIPMRRDWNLKKELRVLRYDEAKPVAFEGEKAYNQ